MEEGIPWIAYKRLCRAKTVCGVIRGYRGKGGVYSVVGSMVHIFLGER